MPRRRHASTAPTPADAIRDMNPADRRRGWGRMLVAVAVGLLCSAAIWIATPYNNYLLLNNSLSDDFFPAGAVFFIFLLTLAVNPLLRVLRPAWALTGRQLAVVFGILLVASVVPGHGTLRTVPYMAVHTPVLANQDKALADDYAAMRIPPALFPDKVKFAGATPIADAFSAGKPGQEVPWSAWARPIAAWGLLLLFAWMVMVALGVIVTPQWRDNERLAFPLTTVQRAIIEEPSPGRSFPPLFRNRWFWAGAGAVFLLHLLSGLNIYMPDTVPAVPLKWNMSSLLAEPPWNGLPAHIFNNRVYFAFVGLAFFMPSRIALSIWFFIVAYAFYRMIGMAYLPPFHHGTMADHRAGAMLALAVAVLWIGRAHWRSVAASLFRRPRGDEDRRNRDSAPLLLIGLLGLWAWLTWLGWGAAMASPAPAAALARHAGWAAALVGFGLMVALLIARVVAETGMPFMRIQLDAAYLMKLAPVGWLAPVSLYLAAIATMIFPMSSRVGGSAMAVQGLALAGEHRPRTQMRLGWLFLGVLLLGLLISGWSHLHMNYTQDASIDGHTINGFGKGQMTNVHKSLGEMRRGELSTPPQFVPGHIGFGAALAALLYWLCLTFPTWPLHPIGLLVIDTPSYGNVVWASIFIGWVVKSAIVRFGGALAYRWARPVFLGLILGEVFGAIFWAAMQLLVVALGGSPRLVEVLPARVA